MADHKARKADLQMLYQEKLAKLQQLESQKQTIINDMNVILQEVLLLKGKVELLEELEREEEPVEKRTIK